MSTEKQKIMAKDDEPNCPVVWAVVAKLNITHGILRKTLNSKLCSSPHSRFASYMI